MRSEFENYPHGPSEAIAEADEAQWQRFELLSAYIDGEVSPQERRQVQQWIDQDPAFKQTYLGLLRLQGAIPQTPDPSPISCDDLSQRVFDQLERETHRRLWLWGTMTAAAVVVAVGATGLWNPLVPTSQQAHLMTDDLALEEDSLMIAINEPIPPLSPLGVKRHTPQ